MNLLSIRSGKKADDEDGSYILATWLRYYKDNSYFAKKITTSVFYEGHHPIAVNLFRRNSTRVLVACDQKDPNVILGYMIFEGTTVHFVYVRTEFRRNGIAARLLKESELDLNQSRFTHWALTFDKDGSRFDYPSYLQDEYAGLKYDPYKI